MRPHKALLQAAKPQDTHTACRNCAGTGKPLFGSFCWPCQGKGLVPLVMPRRSSVVWDAGRE